MLAWRQFNASQILLEETFAMHVVTRYAPHETTDRRLFTISSLVNVAILALIFCAVIPVHAQTFQLPATANDNVNNVNSGPRMAFFNGLVYAVYLSTSGDLAVSTSTNGRTYSTPTTYTNIPMGSPPALTVFNNVLYVAYLSNTGNTLMLTYSTNGSTFATPYQAVVTTGGYLNSSTGPALAVYNGQLYIAYSYEYSGYVVYDVSSNGMQFTGPVEVSGQPSSNIPALAVANNTLYAALQSTTTHQLVVDTYNGSYFTDEKIYPTTIGSPPAMVGAFNGLVVAFKSNDSYNRLFELTGSTGATLQTPATEYPTTLPNAPGLAQYNGTVYLTFQSNDKYHVLFGTTAN